jgi:hypothetical protein
VILSNLLPGFREIRAPLAAGFLWVAVAWLELDNHVSTHTSSSGAVNALSRLRDNVGVGAAAVAVTFVAFLVGALWQPISVRLADLLWSMKSTILINRRSRVSVQTGWIEEGYEDWHSPFSRRISNQAWKQLWVVGQRLFEAVDELILASLPSKPDYGEAFADLLHRYLHESRFVDDESGHALSTADFDEMFKHIGSPRDDWWLREAHDMVKFRIADGVWRRLHPVQLGHQDLLVLEPKVEQEHGQAGFDLLGEAEITAWLFEELPKLAQRLVGEQQEHFLEASRQQGEIVFRYALAIPVAVTTSVVAYGLGVPAWAWVAATLVGILAGAGLLADAWRLDTERNDYLVELLSIGRAKSPTFERLLERASTVSKTRSGAPLDEAEASAVASDERDAEQRTATS